MSGFKVGMEIPRETELVFNGCVFATIEEAHAAGSNALARWFVPTGFAVVAVDEDPTHYFQDGQTKPVFTGLTNT